MVAVGAVGTGPGGDEVPEFFLDRSGIGAPPLRWVGLLVAELTGVEVERFTLFCGCIEVSRQYCPVGQGLDRVVLLAACPAEDHGKGDSGASPFGTDRAGDLAGVMEVRAVAGEAALDLAALREVHMHFRDESLLEGSADGDLAIHAGDEGSLDLAGCFIIRSILPDGLAVYADEVRDASGFIVELVFDELDGLL